MTTKQIWQKNRRAGLAAKALQGLLSNPDYKAQKFEDVADDAVRAADALIAALDSQDSRTNP
jgi:hypothetical protein